MCPAFHALCRTARRRTAPLGHGIAAGRLGAPFLSAGNLFLFPGASWLFWESVHLPERPGCRRVSRKHMCLLWTLASDQPVFCDSAMAGVNVNSSPALLLMGCLEAASPAFLLSPSPPPSSSSPSLRCPAMAPQLHGGAALKPAGAALGLGAVQALRVVLSWRAWGACLLLPGQCCACPSLQGLQCAASSPCRAPLRGPRQASASCCRTVCGRAYCVLPGAVHVCCLPRGVAAITHPGQYGDRLWQALPGVAGRAEGSAGRSQRHDGESRIRLPTFCGAPPAFLFGHSKGQVRALPMLRMNRTAGSCQIALMRPGHGAQFHLQTSEDG